MHVQKLTHPQDTTKGKWITTRCCAEFYRCFLLKQLIKCSVYITILTSYIYSEAKKMNRFIYWLPFNSLLFIYIHLPPGTGLCMSLFFTIHLFVVYPLFNKGSHIQTKISFWVFWNKGVLKSGYRKKGDAVWWTSWTLTCRLCEHLRMRSDRPYGLHSREQRRRSERKRAHRVLQQSKTTSRFYIHVCVCFSIMCCALTRIGKSVWHHWGSGRGSVRQIVSQPIRYVNSIFTPRCWRDENGKMERKSKKRN